MRRRRRVAALLLAVPIGAVALFGGEISRARIRPRGDYGPVLQLDAGDGPDVVWLGDSTASGVGVTVAADALPRQAAAASGVAQHVVSLAVSGAKAADVLAAQVPRIPPAAKVVVIDVGANDVAHGARVATFRRQYARILSLVPKGAAVVVLGVPDMGSPPRLDQPLRAVVGWRGRDFDRVVRSLARSRGARYVDIAGATGPSFRREPRRYFFADGYHPNASGYGLWARAVAPALRSALAP